MKSRAPIENDVLSTIFKMSTPTRKAISRYLDSSHVTIGKALQSLEERGEIKRADLLPASGSGRPSDIFSCRADAFYGIGVYLRPTLATCVLIDAAKHTIGEWSLPLPNVYRQKQEVESVLHTVGDWAIQQATDVVDEAAIIALGLSAPGFVDTSRCIWTAGLQFGRFNDLSVRDILKDLPIRNVYIEDTSRSLTRFELMKVAEPPSPEHFVLINMGVGLGAGIVVGGEVFLGNGGITGEIGHIPLGNNNNRCACGNLGCTETVLSASGIRNLFKERLDYGVRSDLYERIVDGRHPTIQDILDSALEGDHFTRTTLSEIGAMLGELLHIVVKTFTPGHIVLAGEGARLSDFFVPATIQNLQTLLLPELMRHVEFRVQEYTNNNEAMGAGLYAMSKGLIENTSTLVNVPIGGK